MTIDLNKTISTTEISIRMKYSNMKSNRERTKIAYWLEFVICQIKGKKTSFKKISKYIILGI